MRPRPFRRGAVTLHIFLTIILLSNVCHFTIYIIDSTETRYPLFLSDPLVFSMSREYQIFEPHFPNYGSWIF